MFSEKEGYQPWQYKNKVSQKNNLAHRERKLIKNLSVITENNKSNYL